jgi:hypothetical protein
MQEMEIALSPSSGLPKASGGIIDEGVVAKYRKMIKTNELQYNSYTSSNLFYFTPPSNNAAGEAPPLSLVHGIIATILFNFSSNLLEDANEWHHSHSMR